MKTKVTYSAFQGKKDDAKFHSVSEFCRLVANETSTDCYGYFMNFYAAFLADSSNEKKQENETVSDFRNRVMRKAFQQVKSTKTSELKETELYKIFSSKNQLFKLVRTIAPCYYDGEMKHKFAKRKIIALNVAKLNSEQITEYKNTGFKEITLQHDNKEMRFITKHFKTLEGAFSSDETEKYFSAMLQQVRKQRKDKFAELKETGIYFFDANENICTMFEYDKMNFATMYVYISEYAQKQNFEKVKNQQENEKRTKTQLNLLRANKKLDTAISTAFNKLVDFKMQTSKEYKEYITDETKRNLLQAQSMKLVTLYKDAIKKRIGDFNENENGLLSDIANMMRKLTIDAPKQKRSNSKKNSLKKQAA